MTRVFIGLGGNAAGGGKHLTYAAKLLPKLPGVKLTVLSPVYISAPLNCPGRQRKYYNCVAEMQTVLSPHRLFKLLQKLEYAIQRCRRRRNAPRRLDIDYLLHGEAKLCGALLTLPHPRMLQRAFVLSPLADIVGANYDNMPHADKLRAARRRCQSQQLHRA